ncbi:uncharacterized protein CLUP02_01156 [Colletotrichum lupini]|uniref:Uncharacterized protein n=1 Tax=Colletotrichum lupini TaxID=145971 RepID=A0A9Q8SC67_9PEZI|nr:uncharacterized protein CLUP02_01156 [Colletotrichum lupini]UQC74505.1 hypothetical protein CLUP02_01156 [Colletotrichum lupini]
MRVSGHDSSRTPPQKPATATLTRGFASKPGWAGYCFEALMPASNHHHCHLSHPEQRTKRRTPFLSLPTPRDLASRDI